MAIADQLKILTIGNSFSVDTMEYVVQIAQNLGVMRIKLGNLYVGGCSTKQHYSFAVNNEPVYTYYQNDGDGWTSVEGVASATALAYDEWDFVTIQSGTGDGSRHTDISSYEKLVPLVEFVKERVLPTTKIGYNITWVGEPSGTHHEMVSYGGNQTLLFSKILEMVKAVVSPLNLIDFIIPTGTAVQNARAVMDELLTRDTYHLSYDKGRFIAGLTFFTKISGLPIDNITWTPDGVDAEFIKVAIRVVNDAIKNPFVFAVKK
ncbi:MAG: DUF4886 domain-containing protein [Clostridia bacterium]|nr:DUF4886 domain-containing protein [Clostridia bacterium]